LKNNALHILDNVFRVAVPRWANRTVNVTRKHRIWSDSFRARYFGRENNCGKKRKNERNKKQITPYIHIRFELFALHGRRISGTVKYDCLLYSICHYRSRTWRATVAFPQMHRTLRHRLYRTTHLSTAKRRDETLGVNLCIGVFICIHYNRRIVR